MRTMTTAKLSYKLLILTVLTSALIAMYALGSRSSNAQTEFCSEDVYQYCFSQNRPVNSYTCECDMSACLMPVASDCTEVGNYLDTSTCTCVSNPSYIGVCDNDPYAFGCPRSFDTVFAGQLRTFGDDGDICSFNSVAWCNVNGGTWSSYGCACSGLGSSTQQDCASNGGTWYDPGSSLGGGRCQNPSGYGAQSQCASSTATLSSCVSSGGRWNPYTCVCTPAP